QVYQTLHALERSGLIVGGAVPATTPASPRRVYAITAKGSRALERWLRRPVAVHRPVRDELLLPLLATGPGDQAELLPHVVAQQRRCRERLQRLVVLLSDRQRWSEPVSRLCLEAEVLHLLAQLAWLERCGQDMPRPRETGPRAKNGAGSGEPDA